MDETVCSTFCEKQKNEEIKGKYEKYVSIW